MRKLTLELLATVIIVQFGGGIASAQTLRQVLVRTYAYNHELNAARAQLRATDENVTQARSGLRPFISSNSTVNTSRSLSDQGDRLPTVRPSSGVVTSAIQINQTLFDGLQTPNNVRSAKAAVSAAGANLDNNVQSTLLDAATFYANVFRDRKIAELYQANLKFLEEQVRAASSRFEAGEATRTDVAQTQAQRALGTALLNGALGQVAASESSFFQIVGNAPGTLSTPAGPNRRLLPRSVKAALAVASIEHPAIIAGQFAVDAASFDVSSREGALLPTVAARESIDNETCARVGVDGVQVS